MCKFCENDRPLIATALNMGIFGTTYVNCYLDTCGLLVFCMELNGEYISETEKVNYCPMCGGKLSNDS